MQRVQPSTVLVYYKLTAVLKALSPNPSAKEQKRAKGRLTHGEQDESLQETKTGRISPHLAVMTLLLRFR